MLPIEPGSVARARHAVGEYTDPLNVTAFAVELAVSEAVTNAIVHGFCDAEDGQGAEEGQILLAAEVDPPDLSIRVIDNGVGMRPNPLSRGLGLGLSLIGRLSDELEVRKLNGGTEIYMRFAGAC